MTELELKQTIAANIFYYRNTAGYTQAKLAAILNYSDKSISKWENADGLPDVFVLAQMAELFGITVDDLITAPKKKRSPAKHKGKVFITSISLGIVWLVASIAFVIAYLASQNILSALAFVYAVPASGIVAVVFSGVWKNRIMSGISVSFIIWGFAVAIILTFSIAVSNIWIIITVAIPLQVLDVLWFFFRSVIHRAKNSFLLFASHNERMKRKQAKEKAKEKLNSESVENNNEERK